MILTSKSSTPSWPRRSALAEHLDHEGGCSGYTVGIT
jgi:hypothetical protein